MLPASPIVALLLAAVAVPAEPVQTIRFAKGRSSAAIDGAVARGERALYAFTARAGQRLTLSSVAAEKNIAFQIWRPGYRLPAVAGDAVVGRTLNGAGPVDDASHWAGRLPRSGRYLLVTGATRGGAEYRLNISIK